MEIPIDNAPTSTVIDKKINNINSRNIILIDKIIKIDVKLKAKEITVYNSVGEIVYSKKNVSIKNKFEVNTENFIPGCYFLAVISKSGAIMKVIHPFEIEL